jgi:hypothetical protein
MSSSTCCRAALCFVILPWVSIAGIRDDYRAGPPSGQCHCFPTEDAV